MLFLYNLALIVLSPLWVPWMFWRARQRGEQPNWGERTGAVPVPRKAKGQKRVWVHAVSVGEVIAAMPILRELRAQEPEWEIVLSVTTSSGHQTAREKASGLFDHLIYAPIDVPRFTTFAVAKVNPDVLAIMETELWPNLLWTAKAYQKQTVLINGRISDRSFPRAKRLRWLYRSVLRNVDACLMQTETDAERIRALGAGTVEVLGNAKFDEALAGLDADPTALRESFGVEAGAPVVVIGSTRGEEEEALVLEALADERLAGVRVIWAPRHLERVPELAGAISGRLGTVGRRSEGTTGRVTLLDTYGELARVYAMADVVVIGGGFARLGGQNLIQALAHGKPVVHGPHMMNFREASEEAARVGATEVAATAAELSEALVALLLDEARRATMGAAAAAMVQRHAGAGARYARAIVGLTGA